MECKIELCTKEQRTRGLCTAHYAKWRKYGDPTVVKQRQLHGLTLQERFEANVSKSDGCWEWTGYRDPNGYGRLNVGLKPVLAHRISWQLNRHKLKGSQFVLHKCDNPPCVRPDHLFIGSQADNLADKMRKKRHRYGVSIGTAHGRCKLTEEQVREIRAWNGPSRVIAEKFGISQSNASDIINRRIWKHLI